MNFVFEYANCSCIFHIYMNFKIFLTFYSFNLFKSMFNCLIYFEMNFSFYGLFLTMLHLYTSKLLYLVEYNNYHFSSISKLPLINDTPTLTK